MNLFTPYRLGPFELRNRIVMAPMTRSRALGNLPNKLMAEYYSQRAAAGLIITEGVAPSPNALGYARIPGLFSPEQVRAWRATTEAVHAQGGRIFAQLMHVGRVAHVDNLPPHARVLAPSAVAAVSNMWTDTTGGVQPMSTPEEMSQADCRTTIDEFAQAARNAIEAGFDGVELHGANGYLLEQFLHPHSNRRRDGYGGSVEKRARFVLEVVRASVDAIGPERVGIRLSPYSTFNDLPAHDEVQAQYATLANGLTDLLYVHLVQAADQAFPATADAIREAYRGPIILNGGLDRARAEASLAERKADLVAFGRPFIANPDFVERLEKGMALAEPHPSTFYTPGPEGYVDYPVMSM